MHRYRIIILEVMIAQLTIGFSLDACLYIYLGSWMHVLDMHDALR
jgi:hypothetical protein